jgi:hypothetical protein
VDLVKVAITMEGCWKRGYGDKLCNLLVFVALVHILYISVAAVEGACVRDFRGLGWCTVGTVA